MSKILFIAGIIILIITLGAIINMVVYNEIDGDKDSFKFKWKLKIYTIIIWTGVVGLILCTLGFALY